MNIVDAADLLFPTMKEEESRSTNNVADRLFPTMRQQQQSNQMAVDRQQKEQAVQRDAVAKEPEKTDVPLEQVQEQLGEVAQELGFDPSEMTEGVAEFVKDANIAPEKMKDLIELHNEQLAYMAEMQAKQWEKASKSEFDVDELQAARSVVEQYKESYDDKEFVNLLNSPLGNHPALIRFLSRLSGRKAINKKYLGK